MIHTYIDSEEEDILNQSQDDEDEDEDEGSDADDLDDVCNLDHLPDTKSLSLVQDQFGDDDEELDDNEDESGSDSEGSDEDAGDFTED